MGGGLRMTLTLIRKGDGKCLVVGDRMDFACRLPDGDVLLGFGSSPVTRPFDETLYVLSKLPVCNLVLRSRTEHWFLHEASFTPVVREEDSLVGVSRISIGLHGVCDREDNARFPAAVFATWDELAPWI
ncbi:unnamed protein product [Prorocentrum cordatum]|uniref:Altered inheritance of mitochondria protein 24, mitochondrial n=1 Tax=Prorocentrum cordatum TaxID=2364126 RepID=A0ABN9X550_9DINO|nr:unnamed protein product [Polarella glacialis]